MLLLPSGLIYSHKSIHITVGSTWLLRRAGYGALSRARFRAGLPSPPLGLAVHLAKMQAPAQVHSRGSVVRVGVGVVGVVGVSGVVVDVDVDVDDVDVDFDVAKGRCILNTRLQMCTLGSPHPL